MLYFTQTQTLSLTLFSNKEQNKRPATWSYEGWIADDRWTCFESKDPHSHEIEVMRLPLIL